MLLYRMVRDSRNVIAIDPVQDFNSRQQWCSNMKTSEEMFLEKITHGFTEIVKDDDGSFRLFRVPCALLPKLGVRVNVRCYHPAGGELRFRMKDTPVSFTFRRITEPDSKIHNAAAVIPVGIYHGDFQYAWQMLNEGDTKITVMPFRDESGILHRNRYRFDPDLTRIILPPFVEVRVIDWEGEMEPARTEDVPAVKLLSYGSSITQGAYSVLGNGTYPAVLARELGVDVCNLGFGGGATLEPEMAEWIVSRTDWHFATLEMGINVFHLSPDEFRERVRNFLAFFASDPLKRTVFTLDMLPASSHFTPNEEMIRKAATFNRIVREETVATGNPAMIALPYSSLLNRAADYSTDILHPAAHTFEKIGCGLAEMIRKHHLRILAGRG